MKEAFHTELCKMSDFQGTLSTVWVINTMVCNRFCNSKKICGCNDDVYFTHRG